MIIDIHTHILPGVDDGSKSLEDSVKMCENEVKNKVTDAICTTHMHLNLYTPEQSKIEDAYISLKKELEKRNIPLKLHLGREFHHNFSYAKKKNYDIKYVIDGKNTILLELEESESDAVEVCYEYVVRGYKIILAHAERYNLTEQDVMDLKGMGVEIQLNAYSLVGLFPSIYKRRARKILKWGFVDYVASDYHFARKNRLLKAYQYVQNKCGEEFANKVFYLNAQKLIND